MFFYGTYETAVVPRDTIWIYNQETKEPKSSETNKLDMDYVQIIPVLVTAIQELSAKVTALENA